MRHFLSLLNLSSLILDVDKNPEKCFDGFRWRQGHVAVFASSFSDVPFSFWLPQQTGIFAVHSVTSWQKREHCELRVGLI